MVISMIKERLCKLREQMKAAGIHCYLIPTSDYHDSEYVSSFFKVREYFSGFTGSAGTLIVTEKEAALFTDGRYFLQAAEELEGSTITLMKMGEPGVPGIREYLKEHLSEGQNLGFDGRVVTAEQAASYEEIVIAKGGSVIWNTDPAEGIWMKRPKLLHHPFFALPEEYSGESTREKLKRVREKMEEKGADLHILTSLDDIAWLFNIRGNDVAYCPVVLAYAVIYQDEAILFADAEKKAGAVAEAGTEPGSGIKAESGIDADCGKVRTYLEQAGIRILPYADFYPYVEKLKDQKVLLSMQRVSYALKRSLQDSITVINASNPATLMKAVKNRTEMENLRKAHLKDAVAVTKFMYWLKNSVGKEEITEISAAEKLEALRAGEEHFIEPSFETICAYGANGAIIHYSAKPESCAVLKPEGLFMVDSGGHYLEGSTDITRTFVLGRITAERKKHFTLVLRAMLRLKNSCFLYGCRGINLDIKAREVLWEEGLDYRHGTGHGVGYLLNVHEGPNSFRWRQTEKSPESAVLEEGMVTTDEPGIYIEGSHGIRIENELLCRKGEKNEYGQFMYFEDLTYVPIDLDGVDPDLMDMREKRELNEYHKQVYEKLAPFFEGKELEWLKHATEKI